MIAVIDLLQYIKLDELFVTDLYRQLWPCAELADHLTATVGSDAVDVLLNSRACDPFEGRFRIRRFDAASGRDPLNTAIGLMRADLADDLLVLRPAAGVVTIERIASFLGIARATETSVSSSQMHPNMHPDWTKSLPENTQTGVHDGFETIISLSAGPDDAAVPRAKGSQFLSKLVFVDKALAFIPKTVTSVSSVSIIYCPVKNKPLLYAALYL